MKKLIILMIVALGSANHLSAAKVSKFQEFQDAAKAKIDTAKDKAKELGKTVGRKLDELKADIKGALSKDKVKSNEYERGRIDEVERQQTQKERLSAERMQENLKVQALNDEIQARQKSVRGKIQEKISPEKYDEKLNALRKQRDEAILRAGVLSKTIDLLDKEEERQAREKAKVETKIEAKETSKPPKPSSPKPVSSGTAKQDRAVTIQRTLSATSAQEKKQEVTSQVVKKTEAESQKELDDLQTKIKVAEESVAARESEIKKLEDQVQKNNKKLNSVSDAERYSLYEENEQLRAKIDQAESAMRKPRGELTLLKMDLEKAQKEVDLRSLEAEKEKEKSEELIVGAKQEFVD